MHTVESPGDGVAQIFAKISGGGQCFSDKIARGVPYFGFYCIFMKKFLKFCLGGPMLSPIPLHPYVCIYDSTICIFKCFLISGLESEAICPDTFQTVRPTESVSSTGTTDSSEMLQGFIFSLFCFFLQKFFSEQK
jgi:hypothetical protein